MKVVHVGQLHKKDDIRIFQKECRSLAGAGYDVVYCTSDYQGGTAGVSVIDDVCVQIYPYRRKKQDGALIIRLCKILFNRVTRPIGLYRDVIRNKPDIVHIHEHRLVYLVIVIKWRKRNIKVIYDAHEDSEHERYEHDMKKYGVFLANAFVKIHGFIEHLACRHADVVIAATPHIEGLLHPYAKKITTVKNYPILSQEAEVTRVGGGRIGCYVGGMSEDRSTTMLFEISDKISGSLYLAGPIDKEYYSTLANNYKETQQKKWFYKGILNREEVERLYSICDVGVCIFKKTRNNFYALPTKLFEYMRAGLPIVASEFPLWKEIIQGANCGVCVNENNLEDICSKINYLLDHPEEASILGKNGQHAVKQKYNWNIEEKKLLQVYKDLSYMRRGNKR